MHVAVDSAKIKLNPGKTECSHGLHSFHYFVPSECHPEYFLKVRLIIQRLIWKAYVEVNTRHSYRGIGRRSWKAYITSNCYVNAIDTLHQTVPTADVYEILRLLTT